MPCNELGRRPTGHANTHVGTGTVPIAGAQVTTEGRSERPATPTPTRTVTVTEGYIEAFALCNGPYQGTIEDFDAAAGITGINADLHNLLTHAHMYNAVDQATDEPEKS